MPRRVEVGLHAAGLAEEWRSVRVCWLDFATDLAKIRKLKRSVSEISSQEKKRIDVNRERRRFRDVAAAAATARGAVCRHPGAHGSGVPGQLPHGRPGYRLNVLQ